MALSEPRGCLSVCAGQRERGATRTNRGLHSSPIHRRIIQPDVMIRLCHQSVRTAAKPVTDASFTPTARRRGPTPLHTEHLHHYGDSPAHPPPPNPSPPSSSFILSTVFNAAGGLGSFPSAGYDTDSDSAPVVTARCSRVDRRPRDLMGSRQVGLD